MALSWAKQARRCHSPHNGLCRRMWAGIRQQTSSPLGYFWCLMGMGFVSFCVLLSMLASCSSHSHSSCPSPLSTLPLHKAQWEPLRVAVTHFFPSRLRSIRYTGGSFWLGPLVASHPHLRTQTPTPFNHHQHRYGFSSPGCPRRGAHFPERSLQICRKPSPLNPPPQCSPHAAGGPPSSNTFVTVRNLWWKFDGGLY